MIKTNISIDDHLDGLKILQEENSENFSIIFVDSVKRKQNSGMFLWMSFKKIDNFIYLNEIFYGNLTNFIVGKCKILKQITVCTSSEDSWLNLCRLQLDFVFQNQNPNTYYFPFDLLQIQLKCNNEFSFDNLVNHMVQSAINNNTEYNDNMIINRIVLIFKHIFYWTTNEEKFDWTNEEKYNEVQSYVQALLRKHLFLISLPKLIAMIFNIKFERKWIGINTEDLNLLNKIFHIHTSIDHNNNIWKLLNRLINAKIIHEKPKPKSNTTTYVCILISIFIFALIYIYNNSNDEDDFIIQDSELNNV